MEMELLTRTFSETTTSIFFPCPSTGLCSAGSPHFSHLGSFFPSVPLTDFFHMLLQGDPCGAAVWATVVFAPFIGRLQWSFAVAVHAPDGTRCTAALPVMLTLCIALPYKTQTNCGAGVGFGCRALSSSFSFGRTRSCSRSRGRRHPDVIAESRWWRSSRVSGMVHQCRRHRFRRCRCSLCCHHLTRTS